ncbi:glycerate kinase [Staphylococcus carnosus]|uniref:Glycerate kinase n=1 Tax=Staphylococcus carnosus (strain TM300) TaxID=396513 RepID=B9DJ76_STACT|nr:glycerate kinase [Staphylococcus carnosus]QPT02938.1 glycerate kinase [Staphylococcus carnosus]UQA67942.1 glycerate kinase [Staphylococcus carnosus]UTB77237.1 glycerate kinase [Staphylococcus carnosus]UTB86781.1 glycerate kinase [Staphylococcus carnosus]UTB89131.1 glycerate kinase [Staphylococcus carnosus]
MKVKKIVIAPDSFKESLSAAEAGRALRMGLSAALPETVEYDIVPMADGGEGTMQSLHSALGGDYQKIKVVNALGEEVDAQYSYVFDQNTAIIELAEASGLERILEKDRNPLLTSTFGTGQIIQDALDKGAKKIILGIGGSATNDGGTGMLRVLGVRFFDENEEALPEGGASLKRLNRIDTTKMDPRIKDVEFEIVCDVDNPLLGERGATKTYGAQKGASETDLETLEAALTQYRDVLEQTFEHDYSEVPGAGAAGGTGIALLAFFSAALTRGIDVVLKETELEERLKNADLCITGEGKIDAQTIYGKTPIGVAEAAKRHDVPVIAVCGVVGEDYEVVHDHGISYVFSLVGRDDDNKHADNPSKEETSEAIENGFSCMVEKGREIGEWLQDKKDKSL